ncbi:hypothetical protein ACTJKN_05360 [Pedobacter sp. 22163]|uniref:hypothetical protein n=1 Tax=Pedobacter sp. 22163 TaxID=3453883 RepID=UPI003F865AE8
MAWEKRVFDVDDNSLYDTYAAIWASDALQYSGRSGTPSSAYNYPNEDAWEKSKRLNPTDATDAQQINANGYSNLEQYLNDLVK